MANEIEPRPLNLQETDSDTMAPQNLPVSEVKLRTEADIFRELDELSQQQQQITERLRLSVSHNRFARRPGAAGISHKYSPNHSERSLKRRGEDSTESPTAAAMEHVDNSSVHKKRLLSSVVKVSDEGNLKIRGATKNGPEVAATSGKSTSEGNQVFQESSFTLGGATERTFTRPGEVQLTTLPRPVAMVKEDANVARRNKRMFGSLLMGTLRKFKEEDDKLKNSEAFLKRNDSLKRAEQRKQEESERLRQKERQEVEEQQRRDLTLRARLEAKSEEKQLELLLLQWSAHQEQLSLSSIRTESMPQIYFKPASPCEVTNILGQKQRKNYEVWQEARKKELQEYNKGLLESYLGNVEAELMKWQKGRRVLKGKEKQALQEFGNESNLAKVSVGKVAGEGADAVEIDLLEQEFTAAGDEEGLDFGDEDSEQEIFEDAAPIKSKVDIELMDT